VGDLLPPELVGPAAITAGGFLLAWLLLWLSRREDRANFVYQRAPSLPVKVLSEHDDAWIRGVITSDRPLACPWFGDACVWFRYRIEKKVTHTTTDSKGRRTTTTSWETDYSDDDVIDFTLVDDDAAIDVEATQARIADSVSTDYDYETSRRRHCASLLPVGATVTALGVKLEGNRFGPLREVPLLLSLRQREELLASGNRMETGLRWGGFFLLLLAGYLAHFVYLSNVGAPPNHVISVLLGLAYLAPVWFIVTYNRLVRTQQQSEASWRQIDVDLGVRDTLIPRLVAVVQGYAKHEKELFTSVAELRTAGADADKIRADASARTVTKQLLSLTERYPELEANSLFMDLHSRLWALEEKLAASRDFYNGIAKEWNNLVDGFPSLLIARLFGFRRREFFRK